MESPGHSRAQWICDVAQMGLFHLISAFHTMTKARVHHTTKHQTSTQNTRPAYQHVHTAQTSGPKLDCSGAEKTAGSRRTDDIERFRPERAPSSSEGLAGFGLMVSSAVILGSVSFIGHQGTKLVWLFGTPTPS